MTILTINKLYKLTIDKIVFGNLSNHKIIEIFSDGRVLSHLLEAILDEEFLNLKHIKKCKTYDFIDNYTQQKYDEKTFTKNGCKFMPSNMVGAKRSYDKKRFASYLKDTNMYYILVDGTRLSEKEIRIKAFDGNNLFECYPNASIPFCDIEYIFSDTQLNIETYNNYREMKKISKIIQKTGMKRNTIDKFYTNKQTVNECITQFNLVMKDYSFSKENDVIIEPSAGNGAFIEGCKKLCNNCLFYDIEPEHNDIVKQDYLKFDYSEIQQKYNNIHIIGNPPFGRQSSLALKFIRYSALFCNSISFILPKSFMKESMKYKVPLNFHLVSEIELQNDAFYVNGDSYSVPCIFQIWVRKNILREKPKKLIPNKYRFVKKQDPHDIAFRRVGVYAGKIYKETAEKSFQSHYFIKFDEKITDELYNKLSMIEFPNCLNTVGPKSISKQELIKVYNNIV